MRLKSVLPAKVAELLEVTSFAEFATMNARGEPIDTPLLSFPDADLSKITMATGLSYPAKAERARRNPKVGLLYWPLRPGEPVVQVIGLAAVRDRDIQQNMLTYLAQTVHIAPETPWAVRRQAVWYWARILIDIHPKQILWWDGPEALGAAPQRWDAPGDAVFPASDPAPSGRPSPAPKWPAPDWREAARIDVDAGYPAYVSVVDEDGFPRVMQAQNLSLEEDGFSLDLPAHMPGRRTGPASLTYFGRDTFMGTVSEVGGRVRLAVERTLPILPFTGGSASPWDPTPEIKAQFLGRLQAELARRSQPMPVMPEHPPEQPEGAKRRAERDTKGADAQMFERAKL